MSCCYRGSTESWSGLLRELKEQGTNEPHLVIRDGNLRFDGASPAVGDYEYV